MKLRIVLNKATALAPAEQIELSHQVRMPDGWLADATARDTFPFNHLDLADPVFAIEPAGWRESWRLARAAVAASIRFSIITIMRSLRWSKDNIDVDQ